jgi:hypothetical protein
MTPKRRSFSKNEINRLIAKAVAGGALELAPINEVVEIILSEAIDKAVSFNDLCNALSGTSRASVKMAVHLQVKQGVLRRVHGNIHLSESLALLVDAIDGNQHLRGVLVYGDVAAMRARHFRAAQSKIAWHEHFFAADCVDEVHGRFDAIEDDSGVITVLNVGTGITRRYKTRAVALDVAKKAAENWRKSD